MPNIKSRDVPEYSTKDILLKTYELIEEEELVKKVTSVLGMHKLEAEKLTTCPSCASILQADKATPEVYICEVCQKSYPKEEIDNLWKASFDATYFGWIYYKRYKTTIKKFGKSPKFALPPPDPTLVAIGLMILSGIIGGLAYDGLKKSLKKVYERIHDSSDYYDKKLLEQIDGLDEEDKKEMYEAIRRYYKLKCISTIKNLLRDLGVSTSKEIGNAQTVILLLIARNSKKGKNTKLKDLLALFPKEKKKIIVKDCIGRLRTGGFVDVPKTGEFVLAAGSLSELLEKQEERIKHILKKAQGMALDILSED